MSNNIAVRDEALTDSVISSLITRGDLSGLPPSQKAQYYAQLCNRVGLDPATQPFLPLKLQGKEILYASKGAAEQLRKLHKISVVIVAREKLDDVYYVTARATMPDGRTDESQGAVPIGGLKGADLANAVMKAETKAKRRVTLSIVGLGMLDDSELDTIRPDSFEHLPQEKPVAPVASIVERRASRPGEGLPDEWTPSKPIPEAVRLWWKPLQVVGERVLGELDADELEMVIEQCAAAFARAEANPKSTKRQLDTLNAIGEAAGRALEVRK